MTSKERNTGSGEQTIVPAPGRKVGPDTRRPPNNDVEKDERNAPDTRPFKIERENSGRNDATRPN